MNASRLLFIFRIVIIADILTSLAFNLDLPFWNFGLFIKTPVELYLILIGLKYKQSRYSLIFISALFFCWLAGGLAMLANTKGNIDVSLANFINSDSLPNPLKESFTIFNRYIFFLLLSPFIVAYKDNDEFIDGCKKLFEIFLFINSACIILGFVFHLNIFSSYNPKEVSLDLRFGYKGLLFGINEVTGVYFLGVAYVYREIFLFKQKKYLLLLIIALSCFLTGTKGCILAFLLLTMVYIARYYTKVFIVLALPLFIKGLTYLSPENIENFREAANINFDTASLFTFFLTGRDLYVIANFVYMSNHWSIINYLFGDGILYSETDLFDLYFFFGIGAIIYLFIYLRLIFAIDKTPDAKYVIITLLLMAFTGGHIIRSGVFPVFFCLYLATAGYQFTLSQTIDDSVAPAI